MGRQREEESGSVDALFVEMRYRSWVCVIARPTEREREREAGREQCSHQNSGGTIAAAALPPYSLISFSHTSSSGDETC